MRRARLALPVLSALAAGCFPSRDNIHDPNRTPDAALSILDRTSSQGCGEGFSPSDWPVVSTTTHRRCLALSALGSDDPQGSDLVFRFGVIATSGVTTLIRDGALALPGESVPFGPEPTMTLTSGLMFALPFEQAVEFFVDVKDEEGSLARARTAFVKANRRPVALADGARLLPAGGYPWLGTSLVPMEFHGARAYDPDGDPLRYCWQVDGGAETCTPDGVISMPVEAGNPRRVVARLRVFDGSLHSASYWSWVRVGDLGIWLVGGSNGLLTYDEPDWGHYERVATLPPTGFDVGTGIPGHVITPAGDVGMLLDGASLLAFPVPAVTPLAAPLALEGFAAQAIAPVPGGTRVWAITDEAQMTWHAQRVDVSRAGDTVTLAATGAPEVISHSELYGDLFAADAAGNLYAATYVYEGRVWTVTTSGVSEIVSDPAWGTAGLAGRPPSAEAPSQMWRLRRPVAPDPSGELPDAAQFEVYEPGPAGIVKTATFDLSADYASGFAWIDERELWIQIPGHGLLRVDAGVLEATGSFEDAIVTRIPGVEEVSAAVVDRRAGILWAEIPDPGLQLGKQLLRVSPEGTTARFDPPGTEIPRVLFVDADGLPWFSPVAGYDIGRSESLSETRAVESVILPTPVLFNSIAESDPTSGGLWVMWALASESAAVAHVSVDGVVDRVISRYVEDGIERLVSPNSVSLRSSPDGSALWLLFYDPDMRLVRLDLAFDPPIGTTVLTGALADAANLGRLLEPSAPSAASPFLWLWDGADALLAHPLDGSADTVFSYPGDLGGGSLFGALSPVSNSLCFAYARFVGPGSEGEFVLRFLSPDGTDTFLASYPITDYFSNLRGTPVGSYTDGTSEYCWFAPSETEYPGRFEIRAVRSDGQLEHRLPEIADLGVVTSIAPASKDAAWLTLRIDTGANGGFEYAVRAYLEFGPVTGSTDGTLTQLPPTIDGVVVGPFGGF